MTYTDEAMKVWQGALMAAEHGDQAAAAVITAAMAEDKARIAHLESHIERIKSVIKTGPNPTFLAAIGEISLLCEQALEKSNGA